MLEVCDLSPSRGESLNLWSLHSMIFVNSANDQYSEPITSFPGCHEVFQTAQYPIPGSAMERSAAKKRNQSGAGQKKARWAGADVPRTLMATIRKKQRATRNHAETPQPTADRPSHDATHSHGPPEVSAPVVNTKSPPTSSTSTADTLQIKRHQFRPPTPPPSPIPTKQQQQRPEHMVDDLEDLSIWLGAAVASGVVDHQGRSQQQVHHDEDQTGAWADDMALENLGDPETTSWQLWLDAFLD